MKEIIVDGIPVLIRERERPPRTIRIRTKKRGRKYLKDRPLKELSPQHRQALDNLAVMGFDKKKEAAIYAGIPEHNALRTMDSLLVGRKSILKKIEELCQAKYGKGAAEIVAEVLVEQMEAVYPLAKEERKDNLAILGAVKEINKLSDNYPSKKIDVREMGVHIHFTQDDITAAKKYRELTEDDEDS